MNPLWLILVIPLAWFFGFATCAMFSVASEADRRMEKAGEQK